jgi:transposase-like protein
MEFLRMSMVERQRSGWMSRVERGDLRLKKASELMGISYRQAKRIWGRYRERGDAGLTHCLRGQASGRARPAAFKKKVLARYVEGYRDFGPTLAAEHLGAEGMVVAAETLRRWLLREGLWQRKRKRQQHRQWRPRREHPGELVQMDGSHHDWFEGRRERAVLMVMVDDANSRVLARFSEQETTLAAYVVFAEYVRRYGRPVALYVDRDSIYRTEREPEIAEQMRGQQPLTQFARAMQALEVKLIFAYSPQAKGRVERTHGTLQDRLIKELRLAGIKTLEKANQFLEEKFLPAYNVRFMVKPAAAVDLHRPIGAASLQDALSWEESRLVRQDWTVLWNKRWLQLSADNAPLELAGRQVIVREKLDGQLEILRGARKLPFKELPARPPRANPTREATDHAQPGKGTGAFNERKEQTKKPNSPWRRFGIAAGRAFWTHNARQNSKQPAREQT